MVWDWDTSELLVILLSLRWNKISLYYRLDTRQTVEIRFANNFFMTVPMVGIFIKENYKKNYQV
ncbi:hypothetical protein LguiB_017950 [Lonicera macranthoides]